MPGRVPHADVARWYSLMDIAVYPRRPSKVTELVPPLKPLEAMAMGLTVVASDVAAIAESVIDQKSGVLFERGNPESLYRTLDGVMREPRRARAVARQGRAHVQKLYTWESAAKRLEDAYLTLAA
jgi:glycosyltransferase involved in cell wall biosynthesis